MKKNLSRRQEMILNFIQKTIDARGYPPSVREIGDAVGLKSSSTVHTHLVKLEKKGYIRRDPTKPRAIEIVNNNSAVVRVPVVGRVAAGTPILAVENIEGVFPLSASFVGSSDNIFMLTTKGDSMINAGIFDGDYLIVRQQQTAEDGDIVVALMDDEEATVKRFYREAGCIRLQPENDCYEPIRSKHVKILGKVIGVIRKLD
ncbi:LexA repressor LexA [Thermacetogenium phaeum DSM 12270]|jgi:repressor LexA|uniref:LexA repressor n=1 Tax=Thermacetogenium phaeum (strain ATCC BAA-254 / DSM 26808 / PB) TaxID=1089553 RepID=K4LFE6_THEPS|nr:transcriptional repressor LexA [Thermacetogenium phaeum]AFV11583.1 LexA repressor LexA [Thermacetogenium phaeum DSM 12270]